MSRRCQNIKPPSGKFKMIAIAKLHVIQIADSAVDFRAKNGGVIGGLQIGQTLGMIGMMMGNENMC